MNPFTQHGLDHLSPSQITTFSSDPSLWVAQKLFGLRTPTSAAAIRGRAVETGVVHFLSGGELEPSIAAALAEFDKEASTGGIVNGMTDTAIKEREGIPDMVKLAGAALAPFGVPEFPDHGGQHRVSIPVRFGDEEDEVIEVMGYMDLVYPDRIIDLKTTLRMPSEMSWNHRIQHAIYSRTNPGKDVSFFYVTPKKVQFLSPSPDEIAATQIQVRTIVRRMARFLALGDKDTLAASVPVIMDGWSWRGIEEDRFRILGV